MRLCGWKAVSFAAILIGSSNVSVADTKIGLGASLQRSFDSLSSIYIPIKTENYLFEPSITYYNFDDEFSRFKQSNIVLGIYRYFKKTEQTSFYFGAKVGYLSDEEDFSSNIEKSSGYYLAPTLGAEYSFNTAFSIGIDVSLGYSKLDNENFFDFVGESETKEYGTMADVVLRYMF